MQVSTKKLASLDSLEEYTFFRERYRRGDAAETALLVLSDNTIRKWCDPRWRIASSRRTRAAALMADMQATHLDNLVAGRIQSGPLYTDVKLPDAGDFTLDSRGVRSSTYGTLEFLTPIVELDLAAVTKSEAAFYERWRDGYQRGWSTFFDPIAIRLQATPEKLAADLTVMPLIDFSEYRELAAISRSATIGPEAGDPHAGALLHAGFAFNTESAAVKQYSSMAARPSISIRFRGSANRWPCTSTTIRCGPSLPKPRTRRSFRRSRWPTPIGCRSRPSLKSRAASSSLRSWRVHARCSIRRRPA